MNCRVAPIPCGLRLLPRKGLLLRRQVALRFFRPLKETLVCKFCW